MRGPWGKQGHGDVAQSQRKAEPDPGAKGGQTQRLLLSLWRPRTCTRRSPVRDRLGPRKVEHPVPKGTAARSLG